MFSVQDGIIFREYLTPDSEYIDDLKQLVVPMKFRKHVLKLAHEALLGGHQGIQKTTDKVLTNFYWPGVGSDVNRHCQSCDICQRTVPKGRVSKVPLGEMPLIESPFERIAMDLIGPIKPVSERGHRYILVIIDYATRYPEAIPLKTIEAEVIAEELMKIYSRLGIPKEVLTDQGSQFVSKVMKEVNRLLSIRGITTTPYHAMTNGLCEKYNGTLKIMLKRMCEERPKDWDRYIPPLLFAYREVPQASTGFSPFELLFGRSVRGPMSILKELWTGKCEESDTRTVYEYVIDLQERIEKTCQLARQELSKAQVKQRTYYNKKARDRSFEAGDEVLLLLPNDKNKLLMQWKGPFVVLEKKNAMDYRIDLGHRQQTFHANMLKKYYRRPAVGAALIMETPFFPDYAATAVIENEIMDEFSQEDQILPNNEELLQLPRLEAMETIDDVNTNPKLKQEFQEDVTHFLKTFKKTVTDTLGDFTVKNAKLGREICI